MSQTPKPPTELKYTVRALKKALEISGLTHAGLGRYLGVSGPSVGYWLSGKGRPSQAHMDGVMKFIADPSDAYVNPVAQDRRGTGRTGAPRLFGVSEHHAGHGHAMDGLEVVDATEKLVIQVSKADVAAAKGHEKQEEACAVAQACLHHLHVEEVRVHRSRAYLRMKGETHWTRYCVPAAMSKELVAFDRGGSFETGEFFLNPPPPLTRLGAPRTKNGKIVQKKASKRGKPHITKNVRGYPKFGGFRDKKETD